MMQVCDTIAELASGTYEDSGWPELLPFIFQCVQSNDARLQESALLIFAQLAHHIMGTLRQYMATLHEVLTRTLQSPNHDVALASMRATAAFVQVGSRDTASCMQAIRSIRFCYIGSAFMSWYWAICLLLSPTEHLLSYQCSKLLSCPASAPGLCLESKTILILSPGTGGASREGQISVHHPAAADSDLEHAASWRRGHSAGGTRALH